MGPHVLDKESCCQKYRKEIRATPQASLDYAYAEGVGMGIIHSAGLHSAGPQAYAASPKLHETKPKSCPIPIILRFWA